MITFSFQQNCIRYVLMVELKAVFDFIQNELS